MSDVQTKPIDAPMPSDFIKCVNCFHAGKDADNVAKIVCSAYRAVLELRAEMDHKYPFIDSEQVVSDPAISCANFVPKIKSVSKKELI